MHIEFLPLQAHNPARYSYLSRTTAHPGLKSTDFPHAALLVGRTQSEKTKGQLKSANPFRFLAREGVMKAKALGALLLLSSISVSAQSSSSYVFNQAQFATGPTPLSVTVGDFN